MKKVIYITFFTCLSVIGFAQSLLEQKVDFNTSNLPLKKALFQLSKQINTGFTFSGNIIPDRNITTSYKQATIATILNDILMETNVRYRWTAEEVVFYRKKISKLYTISGYIKDTETGERLIGANIIETTTQKGIASNEYGFFSITLPRGVQQLNFSFLGYSVKSKRINLKQNTTLDIDLKPSLTLSEIVVTSKGMGTNAIPIFENGTTVPISAMSQMSALGGEADLLRTINLLPGIQSGTDGFGGMNVRGGSTDQNLILLDGVPVYNATHLGGLFSVFNSSAIKRAQLYKGSFPARFGGRLSSVLDVRTKEGNQKRIAGEAALGLIALNAAIEGPIVKDKSSFFFSARRSIFDLFLKPISKQLKEQKGDNGSTSHTFSDINGKVNFYLGKKDQLFLSGYHGNDRFGDINRSVVDDIDFRTVAHKQDLDWGNTIGVLRWNHLFSDRLFANTTLNFSKFWFKSEELYEENIIPTGQEETATIQNNLFYNLYNSSIADKSAKIDFDFIPSIKHYLKFGVEFINHTFKPGAFTLDHNSVVGVNDRFTIDSLISTNNRINSQEYALYLEDNIVITSKLKGNIGLRSTLINVQNKRYFSLQPRISLNYKPDKTSLWTVSVDKMMQNLHLLTTSGIGLPTDLWVPATSKVKPQLAWQGTVGFQKVIAKKWTLGAETYYKRMKHLITYQEGSSFLIESLVLDASNWESKVTTGNGKSYGVEWSVKKTSDQLQGWMSYTFSRTKRQFEAVNFGKTFNFKFDRPHSFKVAAIYNWNSRMTISANWVYETGMPTTLPTGEYTFSSSNLFSPVTVFSVGEKNSFRLPANHHLDVGLNLELGKGRLEQFLKIGIYNLYNRKNPLYYRLRDKTDGSGDKEFVRVSLLPITPSLNYSIRF